MVANEGAISPEERLDEAIEEYLTAQETGSPVDEAELVGRYADVADELRAFLARERGLVQRIAESSGSSGQPRHVPRELGDYEVLDVIAVGGMGVVHRARQKSLDRVVALKTLAGGHLSRAEMVERFDREARAAARLDHPNIVPIYEVGEAEGLHYFSMRLVGGGNLADRRAEFVGRENAAVRLLETVSRAVHDAHLKGILHRDLKPANILLDEDGIPYVTDFGLAKVLDDGHTLTQAGAILGTIRYMSPEQAAGTRVALTPAADVYALGVILYELLTGRTPFAGDSSLEVLRAVQQDSPSPLRQQNLQVSRDLETLVLKCLEKDPRRRYATAGELADDLQRVLAGIPVAARRA